MAERLDVVRDGASLAAERWPGGGQTAVLLHEGVADGAGGRRSPGWLVGASAGGGLALDAALVAARRVAGLVVLGTAVSGAPEPELDAGTRRLDLLLDQAYAARDSGEVNRLETWLWLWSRLARSRS